MLAVELGHGWQKLTIGLEHSVHVAHVAARQRRLPDLGVAVVAVAAADPGQVVDVPGGLLQIRHHTPPLQHLGHDVGGLLTGKVDAAQLGHRVVSVLEENPVVQLLGPLQSDGGVNGHIAADVQLSDELVQEQPAQRFRRPAVAGEQRTLDYFRQVHKGEYRLVQVGEIPAEDVLFLGGELLGDVLGHCRLRASSSKAWSRALGFSHRSAIVMAIVFAPSSTARSPSGDFA